VDHAGVLIVVCGLPGTGKSTVADALGETLGVPVFSVDPIEAAIWRAGVPASHETGVAAYEVAATLAAHQLALGLTAIVDAVSEIEIARNMWREAARRTGTQMRVIEVVCTDEDLHRRRLEGRRRDIEGFYEPTWESVQERRKEYEQWQDERLVLDSTGDRRDNLGRALDYLQTGVTAPRT
jgi:predicted kinase